MMKLFLIRLSVFVFLMISLEGCQWNLPSLYFDPNESFQCGDLWIDVRDDQEYSTVQIGTQCWFARNINIGNRINASIPQTENQIIEKYCYNDQDSMCEKFGGMYLYSEIFQGENINTVSGKTIIANKNSKIKGICPEGWHIPSEAEWQELELTLGMEEDTLEIIGYRGGSVNAGNKMKSSQQGNCVDPGTNCGDAGFDGLIAGYTLNGTFRNLTFNNHWWSSTPWQFSDSTRYYRRGIGRTEAGITRNYGDENQGFHVRCVKN